MALRFHLPPAEIYRAPNQNPAEVFATTGAVEMGLTEPRYNQTAVTQVQANVVTSPVVQITRNPIIIGTQRFPNSARVISVPNHNINWPMFLPPRPVDGTWTAQTKISGHLVKARIEAVLTSRRRANRKVKEQFDPAVNRRLLDPRKLYTVQLKPEPDPETFMNHIKNHEYQHAADHKWLAERIIGWWDAWLTELMQRQITVVARNGVEGLGSGFSYSIGVPRIIMYWCRMANYSGDLYHDTRAGEYPVLNVESVEDEHVVFTIRPDQIIYEKPNLINPLPHKEMKFKTKNLDGTEVNLVYGAANPNPFSDSHWNKLTATHWEWTGM